ncbi:MAG: hypothetical protein CFE21_12280 [Bacteroidetes bacterium B1(2017)]|nr:MAG: hypothetical protein CFE21_12280 [Bacteroidetes bacterium B1(2017)]
MKKIILFCLSFIALSNLKAQDVLDSIANHSCDCISKLDLKNIGKEKATMEFGLCMMKAAQPYEKQLKQVYGIDMKNIDRGEGEKLGRLVGLKMASSCANFTELITVITSEEASSNSIDGTITEFVVDQFVTILIKDSDGRDVKIIWLDYFKNSEKLMQKGKNKNVTIEYVERELFNPKLNDYLKYKVATGIRFDD